MDDLQKKVERNNLPMRKEGCHDDHEEKTDEEEKIEGGACQH